MEQLNIEEIKKAYPTIISKDQFYRICHISKKTASYLLENGLVPCHNSGKATRKYKINLDDVIAYILDREKHPLKYIPSANRDKEKLYQKFENDISLITPNQKDILRELFNNKLRGYKDVLTTKEVSDFLGYSTHTIVKWSEKREIKCFLINGQYRFPKEYLVDFMLSERFNNICKKSDKHIKMIAEALSIL